MEELGVGFVLGGEPFIAGRDEFGLVLDTSLESLKDVCLDVVRVELAFRLLILRENRAHFLLDAFLLLLELADDEVVLLLLVVVLGLHFRHTLPDGPHLFDVGGELGLLVLHLFFDLCNQRGQLLQGLALGII